MTEDWKNFLNKEKIKYNKLKYVECPAFKNERVYFNHYGYDHIIYKNGIPRSRDIVKERLLLLHFIPKILENTKIVDNEEIRTRNNSHAYFWTIKCRVKNIDIRIILRRLGNDGKLHFFSVMTE